MSQNHENLPGTNIPADPRKRSRNHARITVTLWVDIPDSVLDGLGHTNAVDALRYWHAKNLGLDDINSAREAMNQLLGYPKDGEHPGIASIVVEAAP